MRDCKLDLDMIEEQGIQLEHGKSLSICVLSVVWIGESISYEHTLDRYHTHSSTLMSYLPTSYLSTRNISLSVEVDYRGDGWCTL